MDWFLCDRDLGHKLTVWQSDSFWQSLSARIQIRSWAICPISFFDDVIEIALLFHFRILQEKFR